MSSIGGPRLLEIPSEYSFKLCSDLTEDDLRVFTQTPGDTASNRVLKFLVDERKYAESQGGYEWDLVNGVVAFNNGKPVGFQQYSISDDRQKGFADGIIVDETDRGNNLGKMIREVLYHDLLSRDIKSFRIKVGNTGIAQGLADSDKRDYAEAVIDHGIGNLGLPEYSIDFSKYQPRYDTSKIKIR